MCKSVWHSSVDAAESEYWYADMSILESKSRQKGNGYCTASADGLACMFLCEHVPDVHFDVGPTLTLIYNPGIKAIVYENKSLRVYQKKPIMYGDTYRSVRN